MIKVLEDLNSSEKQYDEYLHTHIDNVKNAWEDYLKLNVRDVNLIPYIDSLIELHDRSKYTIDEWEGYLKKFYAYKTEAEETIMQNFKYAWLHHKNNNPHHWEYWLLKKQDSNEVEALDIPEEHVICMIADWHSFRYNPKRDFETTQEWYEAEKDKIILSDKTKEIIEYYLQFLETPVPKEGVV